ncbi:hypothetical protein F5884DRAFT_156970 [Xylogone sp. PMI_703]|nr:hypothetical protein F5884DRAFT_156970 [Xylogone sp. PMI_703]
MPHLPVAMFGLQVPPGGLLIPAAASFPATIRITMAAIDPNEPAESETETPRATLRIVRVQDMDEEDDEEDEESSDSEDEDDEEANGGPSDPTKSKKAKKEASIKKLLDSIGGGDSDEEMEDAANGTKASKKGKGKATSDDEDEDDEDEDENEGEEIEEFVLCTLDPAKNYQQPLDITIDEDETVFFSVAGSHTVYLTGNYLREEEHSHPGAYDSDEDEDYDLSPDEEELELDEIDSDDESDELDGIEDPRITELDTDEEEEAPQLVKADKKNKNKRSADEIDQGSLDDLMDKSLKKDEESKLSKKQQKKLKNNKGDAVAVEAKEEASKAGKAEKSDKKVQFAKNLEQGPTPSAEKPKTDAKPAVKTVNGVKIEDKKVGTGRPCKKGDRVGMRYIGKLTDGKVFDANKKGKPFSFKLGSGEVIKGWDIGIDGMAVGGERRITIPAHLAYGSKSQPGIPGNSTLIFDVKMLEIK